MLVFDQLKRNDRPVWVLTLMVSAAMGILLAGLWYLQVVSSKEYERSQKNQSSRRVRYPALRGNILDRNGTALAENQPSYNVNLYLEEFSNQFQEAFAKAREGRKLSRTELDALGRRTRYQVVSNAVFEVGEMFHQPLILDEDRFLGHYTNRLVLPLPILENLSPQHIAIFQESPYKPPGLNLDIQPLRVYTNGNLAAHLLGQLQRVEKTTTDDDDEFSANCLPGLPDYEGRVGIEGAFEDDLGGRAGVKAVVINNKGYRQSENILTPAIPGNNVVLTIDARVQRATEQALHGMSGSGKGAAVVLDARNGDLIAVASAPTFDPNSFIPRMSSKQWEELSDPEGKPMLNRATFGAYAPGSIFKIIVAMACLEDGNLDPAEVYHSKGFYTLGRRNIADTAPAGDYNFRRAFKLSSNSYFIFHGLDVGLTNVMEMGGRFFLGQKAQVPLMQEVSGFYPTPEWVEKQADNGSPMTQGDLANLCIGQGYITVTPLQMALMTAAIANGGKVFWPRLVQRIEPRSGNPVKVAPAGQIRGDLHANPRNLQLIREAMLADVEDSDGTGREAAVPGLRVCGKTGTAQVTRGSTVIRKDTWFVSYAPYETPRYVVVVVAEGGGSGGGTCAPVAHKIYQALKRIEDQATTGGGGPRLVAQVSPFPEAAR
jgi:penicillin-binding protein 2